MFRNLFLVTAVALHWSIEALALPDRYDVIDLGPQFNTERMSVNSLGEVVANQSQFVPVLGVQSILPAPQVDSESVATALDENGVLAGYTSIGMGSSACRVPFSNSSITITHTLVPGYFPSALGACVSHCPSPFVAQTVACGNIASAFFEEYRFDGGLTPLGDYASGITPKKLPATFLKGHLI